MYTYLGISSIVCRLHGVHMHTLSVTCAARAGTRYFGGGSSSIVVSVALVPCEQVTLSQLYMFTYCKPYHRADIFLL